MNLEEKLKERLRQIGADPGFVFFYLDENLPIGQEIEVFAQNPARKAARWKKMKRDLQKRAPETWKEVWRKEYRPMLKAGEKPARLIQCKVRTFSEHLTTGRPGRPKQSRLWGVVWVLAAYFRRVAGRPCWSLIGDLLNYYCQTVEWTYDRLQAQWQVRKQDFAWESPEGYLDSWLGFYHERILPSRSKTTVSPALSE